MEIGFIIKKTITFFVEPLGLVLFLLAVGLYFIYAKKYILAKVFTSLSFMALFLFSYPPFSNYLVKNLENRYEKYSYDHNITYIHVLGSGHTTDKTQPISSKLSDPSTKRVLEGIIIHKNTPDSKLIFTGYGGSTDVATAQMNANLALALGVKKEDLIIGPLPKDTHEEAEFSKTVVGNEKFILVTSATHMPRSVILFESMGLNPVPAPTYFKKSDILTHIPDTNSLDNSKMAIHEYLGILWVKIRG